MIEEADDPQDRATPAEGEALGPLRTGWHPLAWLLVGSFVLLVPFGLAARIASFIGPLARLTLPVLAAGLAIVTYSVLMRRLARRALPELEAGRWPLETLFGIGIGGALAVGSAFIVTLLGGYRFIWAPSPPLILFAFLAYYFSGAIVEELVFRGLVFQAIEQMSGRWTALVVTSIFFGAIHFGNPHATVWSTVAIACEAGLLLGAAFLWRRHLGFVVGLHFAWNFAQALLGIAVSGRVSQGLFKVQLSGSELLTGGRFGLENSLVAVVASFFISLPMLALASRKVTPLPGSQKGIR